MKGLQKDSTNVPASTANVLHSAPRVDTSSEGSKRFNKKMCKLNSTPFGCTITGLVCMYELPVRETEDNPL